MRKHSFSGNSLSRNACGFTLIELIITIVLLGILAAAGSSMLVDNFSTSRKIDADNTSAAQARFALERLAREIREIKYVAGIGYCTGDLTSSTYLAFERMGSGVSTSCANYTNPTGLAQMVEINPSGTPATSLKLKVPGAESPLLSGSVISFTLSYRDISDTATTSPSNLRFVLIDMTVADPQERSSANLVLRTRVALRN